MYAIHKYLNAKKVPQLLLHSSANKWNDPAGFPATMSWPPNSNTETQIFGRYLLAQRPNAKVAALYQNDDYGKDLLKGLREALGAKADQMIIATASYEVTDPTVDSQIVSLQASGADTFFNFHSRPRLRQSARYTTRGSRWEVRPYPPARSARADARQARRAVGIITAARDTRPTHGDNPAFLNGSRGWEDLPDADVTDQLNVQGYLTAS
jgi:branched-chain amino acid transport system substrate-binding protein